MEAGDNVTFLYFGEKISGTIMRKGIESTSAVYKIKVLNPEKKVVYINKKSVKKV